MMVLHKERLKRKTIEMKRRNDEREAGVRKQCGIIKEIKHTSMNERTLI